MTFNVGDLVKWSSQAAGMYAEKFGTVVEIVMPGCVPAHRNKGWGMPRGHVSYVVRVHRIKRGIFSAPHVNLYWPQVKHLLPDNEPF